MYQNTLQKNDVSPASAPDYLMRMYRQSRQRADALADTLAVMGAGR